MVPAVFVALDSHKVAVTALQRQVLCAVMRLCRRGRRGCSSTRLSRAAQLAAVRRQHRTCVNFLLMKVGRAPATARARAVCRSRGKSLRRAPAQNVSFTATFTAAPTTTARHQSRHLTHTSRHPAYPTSARVHGSVAPCWRHRHGRCATPLPRPMHHPSQHRGASCASRHSQMCAVRRSPRART